MDDQSQVETTDALDAVNDVDETDLGDAAQKKGDGFIGTSIDI
ncbi:MAG TPA: hypothetical protein VFH48_37285 [Chloroflexota bacterium]|nr:hypothetical protein [Chloroflexota bacterium]